MDAKTKIEISFSGLPKQPNHHGLTVALESHIQDAVLSALAEVLDNGGRGVEFEVRVPELK